MSLVTRRVNKGAVLLDMWAPGWHETIDIGRLDMNSATWCVLAQVFDSYMYGVYKLDLSYSKTVKCGFELDSWQRRSKDAKKRNGEKLKEAWVNAINSRKSR